MYIIPEDNRNIEPTFPKWGDEKRVVQVGKRCKGKASNGFEAKQKKASSQYNVSSIMAPGQGAESAFPLLEKGFFGLFFGL